jgi:DNA repair exonuclease SbcCD ATPase subunit
MTAIGQALPTTGVEPGPATTASVAEAVPATGEEQVDPRTVEELHDYAANYVPRLILAISDVRRLDQELAKLGLSNPKASQELIANQFNQAVQTLSQMAGDRTPMGGELREAHRGLYQASKKYEAMLASYEELLQSRKSETLMEIAQESQEAAEELESFKKLLSEFGKVSGVDIPALGF